MIKSLEDLTKLESHITVVCVFNDGIELTWENVVAIKEDDKGIHFIQSDGSGHSLRSGKFSMVTLMPDGEEK